MTNLVFYIVAILTFICIDSILTWGLNIQFGYAGILNFALIIFMALGAYVTGVLSLGPANGISGQTYALGLSWPFPLTLLIGGLAAAAFGGVVGLIALKRLRSDYMAIVTVAVGVITYDFVGNTTRLFNGWDGLGSVPQPFYGIGGTGFTDYQFIFLGISIVVTALMFLLTWRIQHSPFGRTLRSIREDQDVSEAFGKNTFLYRMMAMVIGCFYAGIAGGLLIEYITAINPSGWTTGETFVIWTALLIGGTGNNWGAALGALLVPVLFQEVTRFIPSSITLNHPDLVPALRNIVVGTLLILVLWFRPQGIIPERKAKFDYQPTEPAPPAAQAQEDVNVAAG
ncbi:MAG: branched-chain amino acid ABC transporter permease [Chloroflexota bacterium]|nr:branched-chain amino acid ABC transporter permease [Chloroflexota bacterium]